MSRRTLEELLRYHAIVRSARPAPGDARSRPGPRPQRSSKITPEENKRFFDATSQTITTRAVCSVPPRARPFRRCSSSSAFPSTASGDTSSASCSTTPACEPRRRPPRRRSMPPDYNRTRANGSNRRQYRSVQGGNDYAAQPVPKSLRAAGVPFSGDWTGVLGWAGAGLFTAAVVVKADAKRRGREVRISQGGRHRDRFEKSVGQADWQKIQTRARPRRPPTSPSPTTPPTRASTTPRGTSTRSPRGSDPAAVRGRPRRARRAAAQEGGYYDDPGRWWDITATKDSFDPFPGGYPVPRDEADSFAASAPVRPGDRRRAQMAKEPQYPPAHYHPAFAPGGSAFNPDAPDVGTVPPRVPPPRGTPPPVRGNSAEWVTPGTTSSPARGRDPPG